MTLLGALCFVTTFLFEAAAEQGYYPSLAVLLFLALDFLIFAVLCGLCAAQLPLEKPETLSLTGLLLTAGRLVLTAPGRCVGGGAALLASIGALAVLFPVSVFWAVLFGFWLPGLIATRLYLPALCSVYNVGVYRARREERRGHPLTEKEMRAQKRANWWYYYWGIVAVAAVLTLSVVYVVHGLMTEVEPDFTVAVVTSEALPDEAVCSLENELARYGEDRNGDGAVVITVNNYTWSADASLTEMNSQMAGATCMNTDLANKESCIWILEDAQGFEAAYGALSEQLGANWQDALILWGEQPALASLELGSYATAADGTGCQDVQECMANYQVAVFDESCALWRRLSGKGKAS